MTHTKGVLGGISEQPNHTVPCLAWLQHPFCVCLSVCIMFFKSSYKPIKMPRKSSKELPGWSGCAAKWGSRSGTCPFIKRCSPEQMPREHHLVENPIFTAKQHERPVFTDQPVSLGWTHGAEPSRAGGAGGCIWLIPFQCPSSQPSRAHACSPQAEPRKQRMSCGNTTYPEKRVWAVEIPPIPCQECRPWSTVSSAPAMAQSPAFWIYEQGKSCSQSI